MIDQREFIYQVFIKTFNDGLNTGSGNLQGVINKLDYLQSLGITKIWLTPFYVSEFKDSGYDVIDYYNVDPSMGTNDDISKLIMEARKRNIGIIIDLVLNHTSHLHPWFQKALQGNRKYQKYYIFKNSKNGTPTNWKSKMGGSAWEYVPNLNLYYLHLFSKEQPDLNWRNYRVRKEVKKIIKYWLKKGVSGFRLDVCNLYSKPLVFKNDEQGDGRRFYTDHKKINKYFELINKWTKQNTDFILLGELSSTTKNKAINYVKDENKELNLIFNFHHLKVDYLNNQKWTNQVIDKKMFYEIIKEWQMYFQSHNGLLSLFLNNHDQPRSNSRFGNTEKYWYESTTSIAAFMYLLRGIPVIYQGEEIGMTNYPFTSLKQFWDVETLGNIADLKAKDIKEEEILTICKQKSRENSRTVMQWNNKVNAGFTDLPNALIKINPNYSEINVEQQYKRNNSVWSFYKQLITIRKEYPAIYSGKIDFLSLSNSLFAYRRYTDTEEIIVIANWTEDTLNIDNIKYQLNGYEVILDNYQQGSFTSQQILPYQVILLYKSLK